MGRVLSLLIVLALVSPAYALTCPSGQQVGYETTSAAGTFNNCAAGSRFGSQSEVLGCFTDGTDNTCPSGSITQWTRNAGTRLSTGFVEQNYHRSIKYCSGAELSSDDSQWKPIYWKEVCWTPPPSTPPPPTQDEICAALQGGSEGMDTALGATTACVDGCMVNVTGTGSVGLCFGASCPTDQQRKSTVGEYTGASCSAGVDDPNPTKNPEQLLPDGTGGVCITGTNKCVSQAKKNCGYVNGEYRCITSSQLTPDNPCVTTASGAQFCRDDAPTPPVPNDGTPGEKAPPDAQFQLFETRTGGGSLTGVNYYSPERVRLDSGDGGNDDAGEAAGEGDCGSSRRPCHVVVDGGSAGSGDGGGDGTAPAECGAPGQPPCKIDESGDGDKNFDGPADPEAVNDFGQSLTNFRSSIGASPIAQAMAGLANGIPTGGAAPSASFQAFDRTFVYAVPPEVESAIRAVLSVVMKLVWSIVAVMLFMRA